MSESDAGRVCSYEGRHVRSGRRDGKKEIQVIHGRQLRGRIPGDQGPLRIVEERTHLRGVWEKESRGHLRMLGLDLILAVKSIPTLCGPSPPPRRGGRKVER